MKKHHQLLPQKPGLPIKTEGLNPSAKGKLYIQYGLTRHISQGGMTDLHHGVKVKNVERILSKRMGGNIKKVVMTIGSKKETNGNNTYVLYKAPIL